MAFPMINAQNIILSMLPIRARNSTETNIREIANVIYLIHPIFSRGVFGTLYGRKSSTIAVQQAYPHQPLPKSNGPKIFATA